MLLKLHCTYLLNPESTFITQKITDKLMFFVRTTKGKEMVTHIVMLDNSNN